jgi:hypothetical protein
MAIAALAALAALETLTITPGDAQVLVSTAQEKGSATGYREDGPLAGVMITVHYAGGGMFLVELH